MTLSFDQILWTLEPYGCQQIFSLQVGYFQSLFHDTPYLQRLQMILAVVPIARLMLMMLLNLSPRNNPSLQQLHSFFLQIMPQSFYALANLIFRQMFVNLPWMFCLKSYSLVLTEDLENLAKEGLWRMLYEVELEFHTQMESQIPPLETADNLNPYFSTLFLYS